MLDAFCNLKKLKKFSLRKMTKSLGLDLSFFIVALPCVAGIPCYFARPTYTTTVNSGLRSFSTISIKAKRMHPYLPISMHYYLPITPIIYG